MLPDLFVPLASLVVLAFPAPVASQTPTPLGETPDGIPFYQWDPSQSWPGGSQADSRLDQPVSFWGAGIPLRDVFASVEQQTGVEIRFFPPGDDNERICVNLYLNSSNPPSLRDLMAQLSWVTDCAFACAGSAEDTVYYLLSTGVAQGAAAAMREREAQAHQECQDRLQALKDRCVQIEQALQLPREEAIDLYLERDDALLLTVLNPARRAAAEIVCRHALPFLETIRFDPTTNMAYGTRIRLSDLTEEDRALLATAFPLSEEDYEDPQAFCTLIVHSDGLAALSPPRHPGDPPLRLDSYIKVIEAVGDIHSRPQDELALRRALGETITPADEETYVAQRTSEIAADRQERARQRRAAGRSLSPQILDLLTRVVLPLPAGVQQPAWRIEEEVARASGMHVIADGLLDAKVKVPGSDGEAGRVNGLSALEAFCNASGRNFMRSPEWEWGDAERCLHLRTTNRDVWRAAMLPQPLLDWLDGQLAPHLPKPQASGERPARVAFDLPVEAEKWARWIATVSDSQIRYGALVPCGEPSDLLDAARRSAWQAATEPAERHLSVLRFLGSLNAAQWQYARDGSLKSPRDLSPDQVMRVKAAVVEGSTSAIKPQGHSYVLIALSEGSGESRERRVTSVTYNEEGQRLATARATVGGRSGEEDDSGMWHRVSLTGMGHLLSDDHESVVFEKHVPFLPISIHVSVGPPRRQD